MKAKLRNALGVVLSVALLAWAFHGVKINVVIEHLRDSNLLLFAATAIAGTLIFPLRARRWRTILDPVAYHLPFGMLWRATAIGMMANNVLPARAGEPARAYALTRETPRVGFSAAFASLAVDRIFDALVVLLLMLVGMLDPALPEGAGRVVAKWMGGGALVMAIAVVALYLIVVFPDRVIRVYELFARRVAPRFEQRGREALLSFASGLGVLKHPGHALAVFGWTLAHWLLNAVAYWLAFRAVGIDAPFSAALLLQGLVAIGVAVPSAPGFFGIFEAVGTLGLGLYGVDHSRALSWAIGYHIVTYIPITLIGIYYVGRLGLNFRDLRQASTEADTAAVSAQPAERSTAGEPTR
jgi:uncharacterized protein (TIRG00374 family)